MKYMTKNMKIKHTTTTRQAIFLATPVYERVRVIAEKNHRKITDQILHWVEEETNTTNL